MRMIKPTLVCLLAALAIAVATAAFPLHQKQPEATEPAYVVVTELNPILDGKEVTMSFKVSDTYLISGSVPIGQFPSFGISPVLVKGAPNFSVLVSGDLA